MIYLLIVSVMWAFSFGLIKNHLAGLDPSFVAFARMLIAFLLFAPLMRLRGVRLGLALRLALLGGLQFGVMYVAYIHSFRYLLAHQVALYTVFTPLYVTLINDALDRRVRARFLLTALLAVAGGYVALRGDIERIDMRTGFVILQGSNLCFAAGQILYKRVMARHAGLKDASVFGYLYLGAAAVTAAAALGGGRVHLDLSPSQLLTLAYLGVLASGFGFFLWNVGARRTHPAHLAVLNNLKVPLAVAVSIIFFSEAGDLSALAAGGGLIIAAVALNDVFARRIAERS